MDPNQPHPSDPLEPSDPTGKTSSPIPTLEEATRTNPPSLSAGAPPLGTPLQPPTQQPPQPGSPQPGSPYAGAAYAGPPYGGPPYGAAPIPPQRPYTPPRKRSGVRIAILISVVLLVFFLCSGLFFTPSMGGGSKGLIEKTVYPYDSWTGDKVAVITISGLITQNVDGYVDRQVQEVLEDESIKAVVLRVDSPGGTVSGSDYYLYRLLQMKRERDIPIVVSMGSMAASGGYYVAMCGDKIYAEQSTFTGSIGVKIPLFNASELCETIGIEDTTIASHRLKGMGGMARPMTEEEREIWQELVDDAFGTFKQVVRDGRPQFEENPEELDAIATGQIFTANQALENGLIDEIGFLDAAIDDAIERANLDPKKVRVVRYGRTPTLTDLLLGAEAEEEQVDPLSLLDMATPTAYYICPRGFPLQ